MKNDSNKIEMWTVYENPKDFPGQFVARRFDVITGDLQPRPTKEALMGQTLQAIRKHFSQQGYTWLPRNAGDDPVIVGTYMR